jgi:TonB family protein
MHTMPQPDPLGRYFAGSLGVHVVVVGLIALSGVWKFSKNSWGSEHASSGSIGVTMVKSIPIPHEPAPENPLANDSQSNVPQAPPTPIKTQAQVKAPEPKAIPIPDKNLRKISPKQQSRELYRPPAQEYRPNQVYSQTPQAVSSKNYGVQGSGGIDMGSASVFGYKWGAYANNMHDRIAGKWSTAGVHALPAQRAGISFTITRNGTIRDAKITHPSGSFDLDTSAYRAVLDASPLDALPADFPNSEATVELFFQLRQ